MIGNAENFYFAQLTDIHIGTSPKPEDANRLLRWALSELDSFDPKPEILLCTGDSVCNGTRGELLEFRQLMDSCSIPFVALPANHDLWGEKDDSAWLEIVGPMRKSVTLGNFKFLTSLKRGNIDLRTQCRLCNSNGNITVDVVSVTLKHIVLLDADGYDKISRRASVSSVTALTAKSDTFSVIYSRGDVHAELQSFGQL